MLRIRRKSSLIRSFWESERERGREGEGGREREREGERGGEREREGGREGEAKGGGEGEHHCTPLAAVAADGAPHARALTAQRATGLTRPERQLSRPRVSQEAPTSILAVPSLIR